jgi:hypothetical protein
MRRRTLAALSLATSVLALVLYAACGGDEETTSEVPGAAGSGAPDGGAEADVSVEATGDVRPDAVPEGGPDAGPEAAQDARPDAKPDAGGDAAAEADARPDGACPQYNELRNVYFGDLHVHTSWSIDSYVFANRNDPHTAYAFAKGTPVAIGAGADGGVAVSSTIDRKLDFAAVTDHSEFLSAASQCVLNHDGHADKLYCKTALDQGSSAQQALLVQALLQLAEPNPQGLALCKTPPPNAPQDCVAAVKYIWEEEKKAANLAYSRCDFSTLMGYEWTANTMGANLHRIVLFGSDKVPDRPIDYIEHPTPMQLWQALEAQCQASSGCEALTIPHNSNSSMGRMWETVEDSKAIKYMKKYQTLVEITQHKGASECLPGTWLADPTCDFELVEGSFLTALIGIDAGFVDKDTQAKGYVRDGLARGLTYYVKNAGASDPELRGNPIKLGIIASTDTHNGTPANVNEKTWPGHAGAGDNSAAVRLTKYPTLNPGGVAAVWATQNAREEIFAALKRRETYGTSGPRMKVRFFASSEVTTDAQATQICAGEHYDFVAKVQAAGGRPMGSDLAAVQGHSPYLFIFAERDEANLAELDIIKLYADANGDPHMVLQVSKVDTSATGHACIFWKDPTFDPTQAALYYARVLEEPTWRWSHHDCLAAQGALDGGQCDANTPRDAGGLNYKVQERAWTSPIFFEPL